MNTAPALLFVPGDSTAAAVAMLPAWARSGNYHNADLISVDKSGTGHWSGSDCWDTRTFAGDEPFGRLMVERRLCLACHCPDRRAA